MKLNEIYGKYQYQIEELEETLKRDAANDQQAEVDRNTEEEERVSRFSASFYGPLFTSGISIQSDDASDGVIEGDKDHRYYRVDETHTK